MKIEYHLNQLNNVEKSEIHDMIEHLQHSLEHIEKQCSSQLKDGRAPLDLRIEKTHDKQGHCKYTIHFKCHIPSKKELAIKKEGFDLIPLMQEAIEAMSNSLDHTIEREKSKRYSPFKMKMRPGSDTME